MYNKILTSSHYIATVNKFDKKYKVKPKLLKQYIGAINKLAEYIIFDEEFSGVNVLLDRARETKHLSEICLSSRDIWKINDIYLYLNNKDLDQYTKPNVINLNCIDYSNIYTYENPYIVNSFNGNISKAINFISHNYDSVIFNLVIKNLMGYSSMKIKDNNHSLITGRDGDELNYIFNNYGLVIGVFIQEIDRLENKRWGN